MFYVTFSIDKAINYVLVIINSLIQSLRTLYELFRLTKFRTTSLISYTCSVDLSGWYAYLNTATSTAINRLTFWLSCGAQGSVDPPLRSEVMSFPRKGISLSSVAKSLDKFTAPHCQGNLRLMDNFHSNTSIVGSGPRTPQGGLHPRHPPHNISGTFSPYCSTSNATLCVSQIVMNCKDYQAERLPLVNYYEGIGVSLTLSSMLGDWLIDLRVEAWRRNSDGHAAPEEK